MPTINVNKKEFLKNIGKKLSDEAIEEKISMMGVAVEEVKDNEIIVEVFPNRPDLLSEYGLARAASTFLGTSKGLKKYNVNESNYVLRVEKTLENWSYAVAAVVKGLRLNDTKIREIIQIQEKLGITFLRNRKKGGLGLYPLEKIKFPVKFTSELKEKIKYRPLEYPKVLSAEEILEKHPTGIKYKHLVQGWKKFPIFIDSKNTLMSMPPIINSHDVGKITEDTTDVFVECTGPDFKTINAALNILVTALADMGGRIYEVKCVYGKKTYIIPNLKSEEVKIDVDYIKKRIGLDLKPYEVSRLLEKMGYGIKKKGKDLFALVPAYRADVIHQIDLAEDVAIAYGYDNLKEEIPNVATIAEENKFEVFKRKISNVLTGLGLLETHTYNLTSKENQTIKMNINIKCVELLNSLNEEYNVLRAWMIPSLIQILKENKHNEYPQNIFCSGNVFSHDSEKDTGIKESIRLAVVLSSTNANFTEIKQILDSLAKALDFKYQIKEVEHSSFIPGRIGRISVNSVDIAYIGEIHPQVLENFNLEMPVAALEINLSDLYGLIIK
ncbi:phenylalanine--tRNA ligase subunit beta [Candidatus Woesearchaeota archaeon]|nr:phenylalanine--tRNA ligase subunit beta [Candidatus Woesearchaeota archaeon]